MPWFYERKRGEWEITEASKRAQFQFDMPGLRRKKDRRLPNELVGKALLSFSLDEPVIARTKKDAVGVDPNEGYYADIFMKDRDVYELAVAALVAGTIIDREQADLIGLQGEKAPKTLDIAFNILQL